MKLKSFSGLGGLKAKLEKEAEERARQEAIRQEEERKRKEEERKRLASKNFFKNAMKSMGVEEKDYTNGKAHIEKEKPKPYPLQKKLDEQEVLKESLSDEIGIEHLLASDESLSYHKPTVSPNIPKQLRSGKWSIKGSLDLHGYTSDEARQLLVVFLNEQRKLGNRAVRIIHGKGYGSEGRKPVLKEKVPVWLVQRREVLAFVQAPENDGGSGALLVLLSPAD